MGTMVTKDQLRWTDANTHSVKEYRKQVDSGTIKPVYLDGNLKDLIAKYKA